MEMGNMPGQMPGRKGSTVLGPCPGSQVTFVIIL